MIQLSVAEINEIKYKARQRLLDQPGWHVFNVLYEELTHVLVLKFNAALADEINMLKQKSCICSNKGDSNV